MGILKAYPLPNISGFLNGNQNWLRRCPSAASAQGTLVGGFQSDGQSAPPVPPHELRLSGSICRLDGGSNRRPKYFNRPNQTNSLNHIWTISPTMVNELLATVSLDDVYIPVDTANYLRPHQGGHQLSVHFPGGQADSHAHSDGQPGQLLRPERRSVPVALGRPDLQHFRKAHLGEGQPHAQVRHAVRKVG